MRSARKAANAASRRLFSSSVRAGLHATKEVHEEREALTPEQTSDTLAAAAW